MAFASGVSKTVAIAKETTWGVKPLANSAKYYRRVSCTLNLSREQFQSAEITTTAQTASVRSGTDNVEGTLSGELAAGSYDDIFAQILRGPWAAGVSLAGNTDVSSSAVDNSLNRTTGSWITAGIRVGDVITIAGFTTTATTNNTRATVVSVTALKMIVDKTLVTKAAGDSVTVVVAGNKLVIPLTVAARTDDSFTIEESHTDTGDHYVSTGVKFGNASLSIDSDSMVNVEFSMMGKDQTASGTAYFTTPTAPTTTSSLSSNAGAVFYDGVQVAVVTTFSMELNGNMEAGKTVFNQLPDGTRPAAAIFIGRIGATGSFSMYMQDRTLFQKAYDEDAVTIVFRADGDNGDGMVFKLPKVKLTMPQRTDAETGGITQSVDFTALLPDGTNTAIEQSTVVIQSYTA